MTDVTGVTAPDVPRQDSPNASDRRDGRSRGPSLLQLVALVVALCAVAGIIGWRVGHTETSRPAEDSVDVGFMYDMTAHHQQAISMALIYLRHGDDPTLLQLAREIVTYQSSEIGVMNEYLSEWDRAGNRPPLAMGWMQPPLPYDQMPGLATKAQMAELEAARGSELDDLFTALMIEHHAGGIHMAAYAATHGDEAPTRRWAAAMDDGQRGEISEMNQWRRRHGLDTIVPPFAEFTAPASGE